jgi:DNA-binding MarR family transcriptional regulator
MDFVSGLGPAFIGHRLRRLSDRIVDEIGAAMQAEGLSVPPRSASTILLLAEKGPLGPVDIARTLRFSHPLLVRSLRLLEGLELVRTIDHDGDQRRRLVELTSRGEEEARGIVRFNERLNQTMRKILNGAGPNGAGFLETIDRIGEQLDQCSIGTRLNVNAES